MKYLLLIIFTAILGFASLSSSGDSDIEKPSSQRPTPTSAPLRKAQEVTVDNNPYSYHRFTISDSEIVTLYPNYESRVTTKELINTYQCQKLVNGGFYSPQNQAIGLVISQSTRLSPYEANSLFNGFISFTANQGLIAATLPPATVDHALQTGPLLALNGTKRTLSLTKDEPRRRVVAATNNGGQTSFIVIFDPDTPFGGPLLGNLPAIVAAIYTKEDDELEAAINLDGGSASAFFIKDEVFLQERNPIGSFFCITN
jgi:uncharacterized protein YigE (DUF2233 family)